ncbi:MAG: hypothetical protein OEV42_04865 [Deltaproteobacteria bacterium]|nr:hypothetical protein [Deltaproteobacteria bacterium]
MKLEKALSLELGQNLAAEKADQLYLTGKLRSKYEFECPDPNCDAQVTCANLDRPKHLRKRDPYYKFVSQHKDNCNIGKEIKLKRGYTIGQTDDLYGYEDVFHENSVRLNLQPPSVYRSDSNRRTEENKGDYRSLGHKNQYSGNRKIQQRKTLSALVDSFLNGENFDVQLPKTGFISLQDLFIKVDNQDISELQDDYRVYYGKAWLNKTVSGKEFYVRFVNKLRHGKLEIRPTFFISSELIEQYSYKKFHRHSLETLVNRTQKDIFLISETAPVLDRAGKHINFYLEGLSYMDYRISRA